MFFLFVNYEFLFISCYVLILNIACNSVPFICQLFIKIRNEIKYKKIYKLAFVRLVEQAFC